MSQHDMNIENQGFPAFRSDLNNALAALASTSAGATAPSTTFAQQLWYDSTANLLKMRNTDNDAWITLAYFDQTNDEWEVRSAVIQAVDSAGVVIKTDDGTTRIEVQDDGDVSINSGQLFVDQSTGNVGIGTSLPTQKLDVLGGIAVRAGTSGANQDVVALRALNSDNSAYANAIYYGNSQLWCYAGATVGMRLDSSGNVGIGVTPEAWNTYKAIQVGSTGYIASPSSGVYTQIGNNAYFDGAWKYTTTANAINLSFSTGGSLFFQQAASGTADTALTWTDSMTLDASGNLLVGTTSTIGVADEKLHVANQNAGAWGIAIGNSVGSAATGCISFRNSNGLVGSITTSGSSTFYNTSSDYRLKENVVDMTDAIDRVKALPVRRFNFIVDPDTTVDGFLAHEAQEIVPESVTGEKDAMRTEQYVVEPALGEIYVPATEAVLDEDGNVVAEAQDEQVVSSDVEKPETLADGQQWRETTPAVMGEREVPDYQGIDQAKLVPLLTGALKEAIAKIEALEARVTALES